MEESKVVYKVLSVLARQLFMSEEEEDNNDTEELVTGTAERLNVSQDMASALISDLKLWLRKAAYEGWSVEEAERNLAGLSQEHVAGFVRYWNKARSQVLQALVQRSKLIGPRYSGMSHRIEVDESGKETVLVQLNTKNSASVEFQLGSAALKSLQADLDCIDEALMKISSSS